MVFNTSTKNFVRSLFAGSEDNHRINFVDALLEIAKALYEVADALNSIDNTYRRQ